MVYLCIMSHLFIAFITDPLSLIEKFLSNPRSRGISETQRNRHHGQVLAMPVLRCMLKSVGSSKFFGMFVCFGGECVVPSHM